MGTPDGTKKRMNQVMEIRAAADGRFGSDEKKN
jgi:hypothetical protein